MPDVFERAGLSTMFTLLRQCMLQWLDHVRRRWRMAVYPRTSCMVILPLARELLAATNCDVCKRDTKALDINTESWEDAAADRSRWHSVLRKQLKSREEKILTTANEKRARWWKAHIPRAFPTYHTCSQCGRDCRSHFGLISHSRRCS